MKKIISSILCTLMVLSLCACSSAKLGKEDFAKWIKKVPAKLLGNNDYSLYSVLDNPEDLGIDMDADSLTFTTHKEYKQSLKESKEMLNKLDEFDYKSLNKDQKITYDLLKYSLESVIDDGDDYYLASNYFDVNSGVQSNLPINLYFMEFNNKETVDTLLGVMESTKKMFPKYVKFEQERQDKGYGLSQTYIEEVIKQVHTFNAGDHAYLLEGNNEKIEAASFLSDSEKETYKARLKTAYEDCFIPAYQQLETDLQNVKVKTKNKDASLADYKGGKEYYTSLIKKNTDFDSVKDYKSFLSSEKNRISERLSDLIYKYPILQSELMSPSEEDPVYTNLTNVSDVLAYLESKVNTSGDFPKVENVDYTMETVPEALQEIFTAAAAYFIGPYDNKEATEQMILNGSFKQDDYGTIAHEGFPGHMYQFHYFRDTNHNIVRDILANSGYSEGWAVYASKMMSEYTEDAALVEYQDLNEDLIYIYMLEIDIMIHYDNDSREDIYKYFEDELGMSNEEDMKAQYEQLLEGPAIFAPYYGYYLRLLNLKEEAKEEWGDDYSEYKFNKTILDLGALPYNLLEKYVEATF